MIYLTLMVSEVPIIPHLAANQKLHVWAQHAVPDGFDKIAPQELQAYLDPLAHIIEQDLETTANLPPLDGEVIPPEATSKLPLALEDEPASSG